MAKKYDLFEDLLQSLSEIKDEKDSNALLESTWEGVLSGIIDHDLRIISEDFENLRQARASGKKYHLSKLSRNVATRVSVAFAKDQYPERPLRSSGFEK